MYSLPHAVYHSAHLDMFDDMADKVGMAVSLWGAVVFAAIVAIGSIGGQVDRSASHEAPDSVGEHPVGAGCAIEPARLMIRG